MIRSLWEQQTKSLGKSSGRELQHRRARARCNGLQETVGRKLLAGTWLFLEIGGPLCRCPHGKKPTVWGLYHARPLIFGNSHTFEAPPVLMEAGAPRCPGHVCLFPE